MKWLVPQWSSADQAIIDGSVPSHLGDSCDPVGAALYFGLQSKRRLQERRIGGRQREIAILPRTRLRIVRESRFLIGAIRATVSGYAKLERRLRLAIASFAQLHGRISAKVCLELTRFDTSNREDAWWNRIESHCDDLSRHGARLLVHGSQSDRLTTPFSDIDLLLVGSPQNEDVLRCKAAIERLVLNADPLQHHGVFFLDEKDLLIHWPSFLPIATLAKSKLLTPEGKLELSTISEPFGPAAAVSQSVRVWRSLLSSQSEIRGLWDWKFRISQFLLLPTLTLAVGGQFVYKGDSFGIARPLYTQEAWAAIETLTEIRANWPQDFAHEKYIGQWTRRFGRLASDPVAVPPEIAAWRDIGFSNSAACFLNETLDVCGLWTK